MTKDPFAGDRSHARGQTSHIPCNAAMRLSKNTRGRYVPSVGSWKLGRSSKYPHLNTRSMI